MIGGMGEEARAEGADAHLDSLAQVLQGAGALLAGLLGPPLQPALLGALALDPGLMAQQPEQAEVRVQLAVHHGGEVELDVGLAGQADVVAKDAQLEPVGEEGPEVVVGAVQELLHQAMGAGLGGARLARSALVEIQTGANQVDRCVTPQVGDGVAFAVDLEGRVALQAAVAQLFE